MFSGVPWRCIKIYGTFSSAIVSNILSSKFPPEISLMICAPLSIHFRATDDLNVSIEKIASGNSLINCFNGTTILLSSSSLSISSEPGLVETAPISTISAPSLSIFSVCSFLNFSCWYFPPS